MTFDTAYWINGGMFKIGNGEICTVYDDGTISKAIPTYDEEQRARAKALGYGEGHEAIWKMHVEHELLHSIVAEAMGKEHSSALYDWVANGEAPKGEIPLEERVVFLMQRTLNIGREILEERRIS